MQILSLNEFNKKYIPTIKIHLTHFIDIFYHFIDFLFFYSKQRIYFRTVKGFQKKNDVL